MIVAMLVLALTNDALAQTPTRDPLPPLLPLLDTPQSAGKVAALKRKLDSIVIDKTNFKKADIVQVIAFLQKRSKELDPDQHGVNFDVFAPKDCFHVHREVSLVVERKNLTGILDEISRQTHLN
jgi:hypothetical protein